MPDPLSSDVVIRLRSDPTAALAAALILASSFPDLVSWAMRAFIGAKPPARANGELKATAPLPTPAAPPEAGGGPAAAAAKHDQALMAVMRANPGASVTEIIRINRRPRNSTMASLERLERAGLVEHQGRGKWTVAEAPARDTGANVPLGVQKAKGNEKAAGTNAPAGAARISHEDPPPPKPAGWIEPLSGARVARHAADGRVRSEMTLA